MNVKQLLVIAEQRRNITNQKLTYAENFLAAGYSGAELLADETFLELERRETQLIAERNAIFYEEVTQN
ncbi:hypothetical protein NGF69_16030 [Enterococcus casseliflavus]|uniref:hypothetical protein n=1 Tax=Enterococcus sp. 4E1_DIV0656 TaxID=1834180 RepID=UPI00076B464F|nr:hypothetical protein [Enterococcus sp. 4E1_DIV0656]AMG48952.1 hypothetical protein AL523_03830 [Enterococcus gallinarum]MEC5317070.1 hypothetical protein [Enterococcus casseliflavus]OTO12300.1 hypothetical protein A5882_000687 [Enterococcus sp. 4E1_DIV0656]